jgi:RimJ/RimL family protein N-acetyltransferase
MSESFIFQTERLQLRPSEPEDVPALQAYLNHPALAGRRYLPWGFPGDLPLSKKQVEGLVDKWREGTKECNLAVVLRETGQLAGHAGWDWGWDPHCPFLAAVIAPEHQRQGYGSEVVHHLLRYLYEDTPAYNVSTWVADWNEAAAQFTRQLGFRECGRSRCEGIRAGRIFDEIVYDLLRPEWQGSVRGYRDGA